MQPKTIYAVTTFVILASVLFISLIGIHYSEKKMRKQKKEPEDEDFSKMTKEELDAIAQKLNGIELNTHVAKRHEALGLEYKKRKLYPEALNQLLKVAVIYEMLDGPKKMTTAESYNQVANVYYLQGEYEAAEEFYLRAISACEETLGALNLLTATIYGNLSLLYTFMERYSDAEAYAKKALLAKTTWCDNQNHPTIIANSFNNYGFLCARRGDYEKAKEYYQKAYDIYNENYGPEHPDTILVAKNLSSLYELLGT